VGECDEIREASAVDAGWLTAVLHAAGIGTANEVIAIDQHSIGTGQVGENVRYSLSWRDADEALPRSVVGKFPSASDTSRATAQALNSYRNEVGFYRHLLHEVSIRAPRVHHIGWDADTHAFVLVMEDVAPAVQGDQLAGCTVAQAELAIDEAVGLHAPTWGRAHQLAAATDWLQPPSEERLAQLEWLFAHTWQGFAVRYGGQLGEADLAIGEAIAHHYRALHDEVVAWADRHDAWTITHGDYRLDNLLFGDGVDAPHVTVVDWQTTAIGIGPADVAYFCGTGLQPADRARHERRLVERYAAGLRATGVEIDDGGVWDGYVLGSASGYLMAIIASQVVERTDRGDAMFVAMAGRHADQMRTVGLLDRIGIVE
jgi:Ecdysteroid kinase-like family